RVTARDALTNSLNVATVKVAELIGYGRVVQVARQMGLGTNIRATPAVALGAYEMTPVDVAAGYTPFANGGTRAEPQFIRNVIGADGETLEKITPQTRLALDPRVAYLVTSGLKDVLTPGPGAGVRFRGFTPPAAGKTGTSHDGWFAGYTSNLLCIVWVGYDDYSDLRLSGAMTAAPIWTEFMKRASALPRYADMKEFQQPTGVVDVQLDKATNRLATPTCPDDYTSAFVAGTEPHDTCDAQEGMKGFFS